MPFAPSLDATTEDAFAERTFRPARTGERPRPSSRRDGEGPRGGFGDRKPREGAGDRPRPRSGATRKALAAGPKTANHAKGQATGRVPRSGAIRKALVAVSETANHAKGQATGLVPRSGAIPKALVAVSETANHAKGQATRADVLQFRRELGRASRRVRRSQTSEGQATGRVLSSGATRKGLVAGPKTANHAKDRRPAASSFKRDSEGPRGGSEDRKPRERRQANGRVLSQARRGLRELTAKGRRRPRPRSSAIRRPRGGSRPIASGQANGHVLRSGATRKGLVAGRRSQASRADRRTAASSVQARRGRTSRRIRGPQTRRAGVRRERWQEAARKARRRKAIQEWRQASA